MNSLRSFGVRGIAVLLLMLHGLGICQEVKLEYRMRQAVERQERNLAEVQAKLKATTNTEVSSSRSPKLVIADLDELASRCDNIEADLQRSGCPANHPRVTTIQSAVKEVRTDIMKARPAVEARAESAAKSADVKNYEDFQKDADRLSAIAETYDLSITPENAARMGEVLETDKAVRSWIAQRYEVYKPLIAANGREGQIIHQAFTKAAGNVKKFTARAQEFVNGASPKLEEHLKRAQSLTEDAVRNKTPAFFEGGIRQEITAAERLAQIFTAIATPSHPKAKEMNANVAALKGKIEEARKTMKGEILKAARPPADVYEGKDRAELEELIRNAWRKEHPKDKILSIRFQEKEWDRTRKLKWSEGDSSWNAIDHSVLSVCVLVQTSDRIATAYVAYANRDNLSSKLTIGVQTKGSDYVQREILIENL